MADQPPIIAQAPFQQADEALPAATTAAATKAAAVAARPNLLPALDTTNTGTTTPNNMPASSQPPPPAPHSANIIDDDIKPKNVSDLGGIKEDNITERDVKEKGVDVGDIEDPVLDGVEFEGESSPLGGGKACIIGYGAGAAVDLHTGSIVFSDKGTLTSDTYQWLLAEEGDRNRRKPCSDCCYTGLCVAKCYSITVGLALVSLIISVVMIISVVPKIKAYQFAVPFSAANCSISDAYFGGEWAECECESMKSTFPCVQVFVTLSPTVDFRSNQPVIAANQPVVTANQPVIAANQPVVAANVTLDNNTTDSNVTFSLSTTREPVTMDTSSYLLRYNEFDLLQRLKCSYKPQCHCDKEVNRERVIKFTRDYHVTGTSFACFYNPTRKSEIIRERQTDVALEWTKVLVPCIGFVLCIFSILLVFGLRKLNVWPICKPEDKMEPAEFPSEAVET